MNECERARVNALWHADAAQRWLPRCWGLQGDAAISNFHASASRAYLLAQTDADLARVDNLVARHMMHGLYGGVDCARMLFNK